MKYTIVEHLATLAEYHNLKGVKMTKEVNIVSWNGRPAKLDIRDWDERHELMTKGITLSIEEAEKLGYALVEHFGKEIA